MFSPKLMEKVAAGQQSDRLHEAEIACLLNQGKLSRAASLKLAMAVSGIALIALMVVQMSVI